ncbi:MAG: NADP-reducing hydrogenase subunit HndC [Lentisphaerae bacterium ADurb.Bin242]|nr:MAG: NADP-reducing hydrogenase subunit HndC [Lentisphaerae bacterium ADurb.Bin242]
MDTAKKILTINGREVEFNTEKNLLEVIRRLGIELPTFCYHSELSAYGACRLCLVEVDGRGIMASCSTAPEPGMKIGTDSAQLREMRRINIELLLANHKRECPSCARSSNCALQTLARRLGVDEIRFKQLEKYEPVDNSSPSLTRDPNKCVLCGDCVRMCREVQGIGAIDFAGRGSRARVAPAFGKGLASVECVNCGQCAMVCPTGALTPKQDRETVWKAIHDPNKVVVAAIAPAVRVGIGEYFDMPPGENLAGKLVTALRLMGFDYVYDTSFAADMTIFEEGEELLRRIRNGGPFPMFTSCCPGWVKFSETNFPSLNPNLSTCRSPQQMFGSIARETLPSILKIPRENLAVVSIMPCTAKKYEAKLDKFKTNGIPDIDYVVTTTEIGRMINSFGIHFAELESDAFDMPLGFGTGAGVIFGTSGGVMEAALRYAVEKISGKTLHNLEFKSVRGQEKLKTADLKAGDLTLKIAVVNTLAAARKITEEAAQGKSPYHFVEVMACPGGCVAGGGQPIQSSLSKKVKRMDALYQTDKNMQFHNSQDNPMVQECYAKFLEGGPNSHKAHHLLHTEYENRNGMFDARYMVEKGTAAKRVPVAVCITPAGDAAHKAEKVLARLMDQVESMDVADKVDIEAAYCPASITDRKAGDVIIGDVHLDGSDSMKVMKVLAEQLQEEK